MMKTCSHLHTYYLTLRGLHRLQPSVTTRLIVSSTAFLTLEAAQILFSCRRALHPLRFSCDNSAPDKGAEYCDERVCLSVCVSVCPRSYLQYYTSDLRQFFCISPTAVARSYSGGVVIHYVFPVLWTTSCLHIYTGKLRLLDVAARLTADDRDYFLQSWPTRPQWVC